MRTSEAEILFVPGASMENADHWMSRWQGRLSTARRIEAESDNIASLTNALLKGLTGDESRPSFSWVMAQASSPSRMRRRRGTFHA